MKCLILAGGRGERLWPLSRTNYPKQFIQIKKNHSIFQETIARNIPYCDSFIIATSYEYRHIVESQMQIFQGVTYRCVYEETPCKPAAAVTLACLDLQLSELVFVVASDQLLDADCLNPINGYSYQHSIVEARRQASKGKIVLFGIPSEEPDLRYGWIRHKGEMVTDFFAKPQPSNISDDILHNTGMLLFENGILQNELKRYAPSFLNQCKKVYQKKLLIGTDTLYKQDTLESLPKCFLEDILLEKMQGLHVLTCGYNWSDVGKLEDLIDIRYCDDGKSVVHESNNATVINQSADQMVVLNQADDLLVVNTQDAVYIGKKGESSELKTILSGYPQMQTYADKSTTYYRSWGFYQQLFEAPTYRIRRVVLYPGKTIYAHAHKKRSENWTIVNGTVMIVKDGIMQNVTAPCNIDIPIGSVHQISNIETDVAIFVETAYGEIIRAESDMHAKPTDDLSEHQLGMDIEPFVKLRPFFRDSLWGGTKLREKYGKKCEFERIAESWELSAHPSGQSIVASGRHKGKTFDKYLKIVGKDVLGWKCQSMPQFPLLIKFIDAKENLSIQVHPDDDYALEYEGEYGKNEMWYILDREPEAFLYLGFNRDVTREEVEARIKNNTIIEILNKVPTNPGDVFFIPAGTVHAIGAGNLICEIQQSSNSTYRLYDYDRRDKYGNLRTLHLDKALDVLNYQRYNTDGFEYTSDKNTTSCKYFESSVIKVHDRFEVMASEDKFVSLVCLSGTGTISSSPFAETIHTGDTFFISAQKNTIEVVGELDILISYI